MRASLKIGGSAVSLIALVLYTQSGTRPRPVRIVSQESLSGLQPVGTSPPPSFLPPPSAERAPWPTTDLHDCDPYGQCTSVAELVQRFAVDNTIVVTFGNSKQAAFSENWVHHMQKLGVRGLLVGMMNMNATMATYVSLSARLRARGVGVYLVNSPEVAMRPQGGRWTHVLPLLRTGVRLLLSDSDAVWLRNPLPYLRTLELLHPRMDLSVSSDAQDGTDSRRVLDVRRAGAVAKSSQVKSSQVATVATDSATAAAVAAVAAVAAEGGIEATDLDIESFAQCWWSMNIGIMHFVPGPQPGVPRAGALLAIEQAVEHMRAEPGFWNRRALYVDQAPMNFRWKHGVGLDARAAGAWRWKHELHAVEDASGERLCGLVNGTSVAGVLPSAQFTNGQSFGVLDLPTLHAVRPFVVHAVWIREQRESNKLVRLREARLWNDPPTWYSAAPASTNDAASSHAREGTEAPALGPSVPASGFVSYTPVLEPEWLAVPRIARGALPLHHLRLMYHQLAQLRNALFLARSLGRALILPPTRCSCEVGFWPNHIEGGCTAGDHQMLRLPYTCPTDHYLDPQALATSPFAYREASFLSNPRTPPALNATRQLIRVVRACASTTGKDACGRRTDVGRSTRDLTTLPAEGAITISAARSSSDLRRSPEGVITISAGELRRSLVHVTARVLHFEDVRDAFDPSSFESAAEARRWHEDAQSLLATWCCTADPTFKPLAGVVPYLLPPLVPSVWRGNPWLRWEAEALATAFARANDTAMASAFNSSVTERCVHASAWQCRPSAAGSRGGPR